MLLLLAAALQVTAAPAVTPPVAAPVPVVAVKPVKERRICRTIETSSSRMGSRICKTESEWANGATEVGGGITGARGGQPSESGN